MSRAFVRMRRWSSGRKGLSMRRVMAAILACGLSSVWLIAAGASAKPLSLPTGRIAFASDRDWGTVPSTQIYVVNADGSGLTKLTNFPWWAVQPTWSPDGTKIAFTGVRPEADFKHGNHGHLVPKRHGHDIYVMNADGSHILNLTHDGKTGDQTPAWSPDGTAIAFLRGCGVTCDTAHIAVMNADGTGLTEITSGPNFDYRPTWSPDGSEIAFERDFPDGTGAIYEVNRDGTGLTRLLALPCFLDPAWSPDGTRISFWNCQLPGLQTLDVSSGKVTTVVPASALPAAYIGIQPYDRWSAWSPDGRWIALGNCCEGSDGVDLYIVSADGKTILPVPNGQAAAGPAWQPTGVP